MVVWPLEIKFHVDGSKPQHDEVFVFGSNLAGIHGAGAALEAKHSYGAQMFVGQGRTGHAYALPTKDKQLCPLTLPAIRKNIYMFKKYAAIHMTERFFLTRIACGYAGYQDVDIAPLFGTAMHNCNYPQEWKRYLSGV